MLAGILQWSFFNGYSFDRTVFFGSFAAAHELACIFVDNFRFSGYLAEVEYSRTNLLAIAAAYALFFVNYNSHSAYKIPSYQKLATEITETTYPRRTQKNTLCTLKDFMDL